MAHYAEINENNEVIRVLVVSNDVVMDGQEYLANVCGLGGTWIQTSYNTYAGIHTKNGTPLRKNFAGIGMIYDPIKDAFYDKQPFPSWSLDEFSCHWQVPTPMPTDGKMYNWDEPTLSWVEVAIE